MDATNAAILTGLTVTVGQWSAGEPISKGTIVGGAFLAVGLAALGQMSPEIASRFATLIVVVVLFRYAPAIFHKFGLISDEVYGSAKGWGA